jgi:hypothetical protein
MRLVVRKVASYEEIRRFWDICDVLRANEWLDIMDDSEWLAMKAAEQKAKG